MLDVPVSLYVHFPWCVKKCPYCDFNSHTLRQDLPEAAYIDALINNLQAQLPLLKGRSIQTVFMGGGTPSLISPAEIGRLMNWMRQADILAEKAEVTLEANPGATDEASFSGFLAAGINRLSVGVQSFDDGLLQNIGRIHSADQARKAVRSAQAAGFERINLDLMYGLPGQSPGQAQRDIHIALEQGVEHLSVYQLTIEANTDFAVHPPALPDSERAWEMQEQAGELLAQAGFAQYEVSAWSLNSPCQHNLNYWRFGDYLAVGAGAHGKISRQQKNAGLEISRFSNFRHPRDYLAAYKTGRYISQEQRVPEDELVFEFLMNALRLRSGFTLSEFTGSTYKKPGALLNTLEEAFAQGWVIREGERITTSDTGYRFLDSVLLSCMSKSEAASAAQNGPNPLA